MPATATPDTASPPLTYFGIAWQMAHAIYPSLDADKEEAVAAGLRRAETLLEAHRASSWSLLGSPLDGEYQSPSLACLAALVGVSESRSFLALHDATQQGRIAEVVALFRSWGLPDAVIRLRLGLTAAPFPDAPPPARLEALRDGCLAEARGILREVRTLSPGLPSDAEIVGRFLAAW